MVERLRAKLTVVSKIVSVPMMQIIHPHLILKKLRLPSDENMQQSPYPLMENLDTPQAETAQKHWAMIRFLSLKRCHHF